MHANACSCLCLDLSAAEVAAEFCVFLKGVYEGAGHEAAAAEALCCCLSFISSLL